MTPRPPLVLVEWDDAYSSCSSGWIPDEDVDQWGRSADGRVEWQCENVGYLIREEPDHIVLAARRSGPDMNPTTGAQYGLLQRLPRGIVKRIIPIPPPPLEVQHEPQ